MKACFFKMSPRFVWNEGDADVNGGAMLSSLGQSRFGRGVVRYVLSDADSIRVSMFFDDCSEWHILIILIPKFFTLTNQGQSKLRLELRE